MDRGSRQKGYQRKIHGTNTGEYRTIFHAREQHREAAVLGIGMFLAWVIKRDLIGELHQQESVESISKVKSRKITGTEFLKLECDEKFWEEDLSDKGNAFAKYYYESNIYYDDYGLILSYWDNTLRDIV